MIDKGINTKVHCVMRFINSFIQQVFTDDLLCAITAQDWRVYKSPAFLETVF